MPAFSSRSCTTGSAIVSLMALFRRSTISGGMPRGPIADHSGGHGGAGQAELLEQAGTLATAGVALGAASASGRTWPASIMVMAEASTAAEIGLALR